MSHLLSLVMSGQTRMVMPAEAKEDATIKVFKDFSCGYPKDVVQQRIRWKGTEIREDIDLVTVGVLVLHPVSEHKFSSKISSLLNLAMFQYSLLMECIRRIFLMRKLPSEAMNKDYQTVVIAPEINIDFKFLATWKTSQQMSHHLPKFLYYRMIYVKSRRWPRYHLSIWGKANGLGLSGQQVGEGKKKLSP